MHKLLRGTLVLAAICVPAVARAQYGMGGAHPDHEFGVDLTAYNQSIGSGCTGTCSMFFIGTPVDVRLGFVSSGPLMVEPRFSLAYTSGGGSHLLQFSPDINLLYRLGAGTGSFHQYGGYFTAGVGANILSASGAGNSFTQLNFNVGIGDRIAFGSGAFRPEAFARFNMKDTSKGIPSSTDFGVRLGVSLWH